MPQMRTVYRNDPGGKDHGKPLTVAAVDAAELCSSRGGARVPPYVPADPTRTQAKTAAQSEKDPGSGSGGGTGEPGSGEGGQNPRYESMTVAELHPIAERLLIDGYKTMNKPTLIAAIRNVEASQRAGSDEGKNDD